MSRIFINPKTGRQIKQDGPTYRQLIAEGYQFDEPLKIRPVRPPPAPAGLDLVAQKQSLRGLPTEYKSYTQGMRGWGEAVPNRKWQRHIVKDTCGAGCFMMPDQLKFPVCQKIDPDDANDRQKCRVDCRGLLAANVRGRQWRYNDVADAARQIAEERGCQWTVRNRN